MKMTNDNEISKTVKAFCDYAVPLYSTHKHLHILYEDVSQEGFLHRTAPIFFGDVYSALRNNIFLGICALTDKAETGKNKNLTVAYLLKHADFSNNPTQLEHLKKLADQMYELREKMEPARSKLIAHLDHETILNDKTLGAFEEEMLNRFWLALEEFINIFHQKYLGTSLKLSQIGMISDADSLVNALRVYWTAQKKRA